MGIELWYSNQTGIRRKGTSFKELQELFIDNITTKHIFEPLACCSENNSSEEVMSTMDNLDFDLLGVKSNEDLIGYVLRSELSISNSSITECIKNFSQEQIISENTPLFSLFDALKKNGYIFVESNNKVNGIIAKADLNKPISRLYLFGIISLCELHLNYWINHYHENNTWTLIANQERLILAQEIHLKRKGKNEALTLLECLQICDKKTILKQTEPFLKQFGYSKNNFVRFLEHLESIRNEVAHSQNSIISNLSWNEFANLITNSVNFLNKSEEELESKNKK